VTVLRLALAVVSYPLIILFIWERTGSAWIREHKTFIVPLELREAMERNGLNFLFVKYGLLVGILFLLTGAHPIRFIRTQSHGNPILALTSLGLIGAGLLLACRAALVIGSSTIADEEKGNPNLRGPLPVWIAIFALGGFAEALWQAISISGLRQHNVNPIPAVLLSAILLSVARSAGTPPRANGHALLPETIIGFVLGIVFIWSGSLLSLWLAGLTYSTASLAWLRWRHGLARAGESQPNS